MSARIRIDKMWQQGKGFFGRAPKEVVVEPSQIWGFTVENENGTISANVHSNALSIVIQGKDGEVALSMTYGLYHADEVHISGHIGKEDIERDAAYNPASTDDATE